MDLAVLLRALASEPIRLHVAVDVGVSRNVLPCHLRSSSFNWQ